MEWPAAIIIVFWIATAVVHLAFAYGVLAHARTCRAVLVPGIFWAIATQLGGPQAAVACRHHGSRLAPRFVAPGGGERRRARR